MTQLRDIPEPVFKKLRVGKKKTLKLFRRWGEVRLITKHGVVKVLRKGGYERVYKPTFPKKKGKYET